MAFSTALKSLIPLTLQAELLSFAHADLDAVAKFADDTEYGLSSSVWTRNLKGAHLMARKIRAGTVCINTHNYGDPAWPFGGYKQSGWGREMAKNSAAQAEQDSLSRPTRGRAGSRTGAPSRPILP